LEKKVGKKGWKKGMASQYTSHRFCTPLPILPRAHSSAGPASCKERRVYPQPEKKCWTSRDFASQVGGLIQLVAI